MTPSISESRQRVAERGAAVKAEAEGSARSNQKALVLDST
jgi:hypothetical protein